MPWRLSLARSLAWGLLLAGWVGLGSLAQALAPGPFHAFALLAAWLLALGLCTHLLGRCARTPWALRAALLAAALIAAAALASSLQGGGLAALGVALPAWAALVALASAAVRACRSGPHRPGPPVGCAAMGALLAWALLGNVGDLRTLAAHLAIGGTTAAAVLAVVLPAGTAAAGGCRAGLFDCSLPAWSSGGWSTPARWPPALAALVMLPMMGGLPLMVGLCSSDAVPPQAVLGLHFAAMFAPALLLARWPRLATHAPALCAALLGLGALAALAPSGAMGWGLTLAHGAAWSVAWSARLHQRTATGAAAASPLAGAGLHAVLVLALGACIGVLGLQALAAWHFAIGAAGVLAWAAGGRGHLAMTRLE